MPKARAPEPRLRLVKPSKSTSSSGTSRICAPAAAARRHAPSTMKARPPAERKAARVAAGRPQRSPGGASAFTVRSLARPFGAPVAIMALPMALRARRAELLLLAGSVARLPRVRRGRGPPAARRPPGADRLRARQHQPARHAPAELARLPRPRAQRSRKPAGRAPRGLAGRLVRLGASVEFEDAYPQRLERGLDAPPRRAAGRWSAWRCPGMNTVDQAAQLASEGFDYAPDAVLLGYVLNDSEDSQAAETRRAEDWVRAGARHGRAGRPLGALPSRGRAAVRDRREPPAHRRLPLDVRGRRAGLDREPRRAASAWARSAASAASRSWSPSSRCSATRSTTRYPFAEVHATVAQAAAAAGARVVDLLPVYRGLRCDLLVVDGADDEHPNEIAHRIAAAGDAEGARRRRAAQRPSPPIRTTRRPRAHESTRRKRHARSSLPSLVALLLRVALSLATDRVVVDVLRYQKVAYAPARRLLESVRRRRVSTRTRRCGCGWRRAASGSRARPGRASRCWCGCRCWRPSWVSWRCSARMAGARAGVALRAASGERCSCPPATASSTRSRCSSSCSRSARSRADGSTAAALRSRPRSA